MSDSSSTRRDKRGWFRRSRPIDVSELMKAPGAPAASRPGSLVGSPDGRAPKRSADMFRTVENGDAWSSSAWAEDGWDDDWSDPSSKRASVRPAADPRPEEVDAWLESGSSDFAEVTRDIAERWVGRAGRGQATSHDSGTAPPPSAVDPRRRGLSLDTLRSSTPVEPPDQAASGEFIARGGQSAEAPTSEPSALSDGMATTDVPHTATVEAAGIAMVDVTEPADVTETARPDDFDPIEDLEDATRFHAPTPVADEPRRAEIQFADPVVSPGTTWDETVIADAPIERFADIESEERTDEGTGESTAAAEADAITDQPHDDVPHDDVPHDDVVPAQVVESEIDAPTVLPIAPDKAGEDDLLHAGKNTDLLFDDLDLDSDGDLDEGIGNSPVLGDPIPVGRTDEIKKRNDLAPVKPKEHIDDIDVAFARGPIDGRTGGHAALAHIADETDPSTGDFERLDGDDFDADLDDLDDLEFEADDEDDWDDSDERGAAAPGTAPSTRVQTLLPVDANALRPLRRAAASSTFCTTVGTGIVLVASVRMLLALASGIVTSEGVGTARVDVVNRIGSAFTGLGLFHGLALIVGAAFLVLPTLLGDDDAQRHDSRAASMLGIAGGASLAGIVGGLLGIRAGLHGIDASATDWTRIIGDAVAIAGSSLVAFSAAVQAIRVRSTR